MVRFLRCCTSYPRQRRSAWPRRPLRAAERSKRGWALGRAPYTQEQNNKGPAGAGPLNAQASRRESQGELHHPRIARQRRNLPEAAGVYVVRRKAKLRRVEQVERLPAELQVATLAELREAARQGKVYVRIPWSPHVVAGASAQSWNRSRIRRVRVRRSRRSKLGRIEPAVDSLAGRQMAGAIAISQRVRQAPAHLHEAVVIAGKDGKRAAGVECCSAACAPPAQQVRNRPAGHICFSGTERQFVHVTEYEPMPEIEVAVAALLSQVMLVLHEAVRAAGADQVLLHLVNRMRPGVSSRERQPTSKPLLGA